jgi:hypothetical protein
MSYTQPIFMAGRRYRVKQGFKSGPTSTFVAGETLIFERNACSHYDNSFVYVFRAESGNETKEWWLPEGQTKELSQQYFEPLSQQSPSA